MLAASLSRLSLVHAITPLTGERDTISMGGCCRGLSLLTTRVGTPASRKGKKAGDIYIPPVGWGASQPMGVTQAPPPEPPAEWGVQLQGLHAGP